MVFLPPCCRCVRTPSMSPKCAHTHTPENSMCDSSLDPDRWPFTWSVLAPVCLLLLQTWMFAFQHLLRTRSRRRNRFRTLGKQCLSYGHYTGDVFSHHKATRRPKALISWQLSIHHFHARPEHKISRNDLQS